MMTTIQLKDEEEAKHFSWGVHPDFEEVETIKDYEALYKDYCTATTIAKHTKTGKFYALYWESYESHYGHGESEYPNTKVYEVQQVEKVVTTKEWIAV